MKLQMHNKWALLVDYEGNPITDKTWWECYALAKEMSVRTGKKLSMIPVKLAEKLCNTDKVFKQMMEKYWIHNAELFKEGDKKVMKIDKYPLYEGGLASVGSDWGTDEGCFAAGAYRPSTRDDYGVVAFLVR